MTGDLRDDDDLSFDDEEFVLEDEDFELGSGPTAEADAHAAARDDDELDDEDFAIADLDDHEVAEPVPSADGDLDEFVVFAADDADEPDDDLGAEPQAGMTSAGAATPLDTVDPSEEDMLFGDGPIDDEPARPLAGGVEEFASNAGPPFDVMNKSGWNEEAVSDKELGTGYDDGSDALMDDDPIDTTEIDAEIELVSDDDDLHGAPSLEPIGEAAVDEPEADLETEAFTGTGYEEQAAMAAAYEAEAVDAVASDDDAAAVEDEYADDEEEWADTNLDDEDAFAGAGAEDDPIYGNEDGEFDPTAAGVTGDDEAAWDDGDPDYSEYEESYVDDEPQPQVIGGMAREGRFPWTAVAGLAALVIVGAAGAIWALHPEWLGLPSRKPVVDRVVIARPVLDIALEAPVVESVPESVGATDPVEPGGGPDPVDPNSEPTQVATTDLPDTDPTPDDPEVVDPVPVENPPIVSIDVNPDEPVGTEPPETAPDTPAVGDGDPAGEPVTPDAVAAAESIPVGDSLLIRRARAEDGPPPVVQTSLRQGSEAFAQLRNEAFFVGTVRRIDASGVTLRMESGEVTFVFDELRELKPLADARGYERTQTERGFVRLENDARLYGSILKTDSDSEHVVLQTGTDRVLVPREAVRELGNTGANGVQVAQDENESWVKDRLRETMRDRASSPQK